MQSCSVREGVPCTSEEGYVFRFFSAALNHQDFAAAYSDCNHHEEVSWTDDTLANHGNKVWPHFDGIEISIKISDLFSDCFEAPFGVIRENTCNRHRIVGSPSLNQICLCGGLFPLKEFF